MIKVYKPHLNSNNMRGLYFLLIAFLFILPLINAEVQTLGTFQQGDCINLVQSCSNCSYNNISNILNPDSTIASSERVMTKSGIMYNYSFCNTTKLGDYIVNGFGNPDGVKTNWAYDFEVTPSGDSGTSNIVFFMFIILFMYAINLFGFFGKNEIMTILGGMALIFLGIYIVNNGIIIYRDTLTNYIAYITIAWGFISAIWAGMALIEDL